MDGKLRLMTVDDLPMVLAWRNAEDVRKNMYTSHVISPSEHSSWWESRSKDPRVRLLVFEIESQAVGVVIFTKYTGKGGLATWAFYSGDRSRRGIGSMMELAALLYAFDDLGLRKLDCEVLEFNRPVINFHIKHGFMVEGVFRRAYFRDGQYYDIYRLGMLVEDWSAHVKPTLLDPERRNKDLTGKLITTKFDITADIARQFSVAIGDHNPVHLDDAYARAAGFAGRIAQGMLSGSVFSKIFANEFPGPGTIYLSQTLEFLAPVLIGSRASVRLQVLSHIGRRILVETQVSVDNVLCVNGRATLMLPKNYIGALSSRIGA